MKYIFFFLILICSIGFSQSKVLPAKYFEIGTSFTEAYMENPGLDDSIYRGPTFTGTFGIPLFKSDLSSFNFTFGFDYMKLKNISSNGFEEKLDSTNISAGFSHKIFQWNFGYGANYILHKTKLTYSSVYTNTEEYTFTGYKAYVEYIRQIGYIYLNFRYTFQSADIPTNETGLAQAISFSSHNVGIVFSLIFP